MLERQGAKGVTLITNRFESFDLIQSQCSIVHCCLVTDLPRFGKPLNNLTISVGREAIFTCIVENLGPYKVSCFNHFILLFYFLNYLTFT